MKLRAIISSFILLGITSCSTDDVDKCETSEMPMTFSAFTADRVLSRGTSESVDDVQDKGVGVFAFYQEAKSNGYPVDFNKYTGEPTFMYNQKLTAKTSGGTVTWDYTPQKYWSNIENDQFSFFAYSPYDPTCAWEDLQISSNLKGNRIERHYTIENKVEDQQDFLWADPIVNMSRPDDASEQLQFGFRHLCAKVGFSLGVKDVATGNLKAWDSKHTITIDEIVVSDVYTGFTYNYSCDGSAWTASMSDFEGSQDLSLSATAGNLQNNVVDKTTYTTAAYQQLNSNSGWLFLAPQTGLKFTIKYTLKKSDGTSYSLTKEETQTFILESGKTYIVKILLSVTETSSTMSGYAGFDVE